MKTAKKKCKEIAGFSLAEALVTLGLVVVIVTGVLQLFIYCAVLSELSGKMTGVVSEAQAKVEEIFNHSYTLITTDYASGGSPGNTFDLTQATGKGIILIDSSNADLLQIEVVVSWRNRNNRIIGEDKNLSGSLDTGEDANGNGRLDSPVSLVTWIARR